MEEARNIFDTPSAVVVVTSSAVVTGHAIIVLVAVLVLVLVVVLVVEVVEVVVEVEAEIGGLLLVVGVRGVLRAEAKTSILVALLLRVLTSPRTKLLLLALSTIT